ncbi:hypothetical protein ABH930_007097 [Kitasatospora sp. GAS204A]|nr:hypothetical protein [Kitasatospora sp. GAS204B]
MERSASGVIPRGEGRCVQGVGLSGAIPASWGGALRWLCSLGGHPACAGRWVEDHPRVCGAGRPARPRGAAHRAVRGRSMPEGSVWAADRLAATCRAVTISRGGLDVPHVCRSVEDSWTGRGPMDLYGAGGRGGTVAGPCRRRLNRGSGSHFRTRTTERHPVRDHERSWLTRSSTTSGSTGATAPTDDSAAGQRRPCIELQVRRCTQTRAATRPPTISPLPAWPGQPPKKYRRGRQTLVRTDSALAPTS